MVYVDYDPVVLAHARAILADTGQVRVVQADVRDPVTILQHPDTHALIDFDEPVAVMLVAILHFVADDHHPSGVVAQFRDAMAPGSYVVISHGTADNDRTGGSAGRELDDVYGKAAVPMVRRSYAEVTRFFDGFDFVEPGLVDVRAWGTDGHEDPQYTGVYAGVGRKP